jgi:hypothetical protein
MRFEDVVEILGLDVRDEKRNRLLLSAVSEDICLYLGRNLIAGMITERFQTEDGCFYPENYPVREFTDIVDSLTNENMKLTPDSIPGNLGQPDAHWLRFYRIDGDQDRDIRVTYRYGYELSEIPALIQACVLDLVRDRLTSLSTVEVKPGNASDRLESIKAYRRPSI